jgi:hypothetical protein
MNRTVRSQNALINEAKNVAVPTLTGMGEDSFVFPADHKKANTNGNRIENVDTIHRPVRGAQAPHPNSVSRFAIFANPNSAKRYACLIAVLLALRRCVLPFSEPIVPLGNGQQRRSWHVP